MIEYVFGYKMLYVLKIYEKDLELYVWFYKVLYVLSLYDVVI